MLAHEKWQAKRAALRAAAVPYSEQMDKVRVRAWMCAHGQKFGTLNKVLDTHIEAS